MISPTFNWPNFCTFFFYDLSYQFVLRFCNLGGKNLILEGKGVKIKSVVYPTFMNNFETNCMHAS